MNGVALNSKTYDAYPFRFLSTILSCVFVTIDFKIPYAVKAADVLS